MTPAMPCDPIDLVIHRAPSGKSMSLLLRKDTLPDQGTPSPHDYYVHESMFFVYQLHQYHGGRIVNREGNLSSYALRLGG